MNANQILFFGIAVFALAVILAFLMTLVSPKRNKKIKLKAKPLENGDLDLNDLNIEDLYLVNFDERFEFYVNNL